MAPLFETDRLRVVLVSTRNPLNIGAAARAMSNFGFSQLRVVNPYQPSFREAKSAVGAASLLKNAKLFHSVAAAVADCTLVVGTSAVGPRQLEHPVRSLEEGGRLIGKRLRSSPVALLFGSEKIGLTNQDLNHCHWVMRIPTREQPASMNLGQAVAVCLYELVRGCGVPRSAEKKSLATAGEIERITVLLFELLLGSGYVKPHTDAVMEEKLRRLLRRLKMNADDAKVLLGMVRRIAWKAKCESLQK